MRYKFTPLQPSDIPIELVKARKMYTCDFTGEPIKIGMMYQRVTIYGCGTFNFRKKVTLDHICKFLNDYKKKHKL